MAALNKVSLIGNLGGDPESKKLESGDTVVNFSLATSESWKNKAGEKVEDTQWHRCVAWRGIGEVIAKYCKKGSKIYVEGKLRYRSYEDKDGVKKYATDIVVRDMILLDNKGEKTATAAAESPAPAAAPAKEEESDDLPF